MNASDHFEKLMKSVLAYAKDNNLGGAEIKKLELSINLTRVDGGKLNSKAVLSDEDVLETFTQ